jgi:hypothetical protein
VDGYWRIEIEALGGDNGTMDRAVAKVRAGTLKRLKDSVDEIGLNASVERRGRTVNRGQLVGRQRNGHRCLQSSRRLERPPPHAVRVGLPRGQEHLLRRLGRKTAETAFAHARPA